MSSTFNADLRRRLVEIDTSISELKLRLKGLEDIRRPIQQQLDTVVYPVLTLPHEITSDIFLRCLHRPSSGFKSPSKVGPDTLVAPLLLLQVCRTWREIAFSTPRLWVYLHLNLDELPSDVGETGLEKIITDWFCRARSCPLSFSIRGYSGMRGLGSTAISSAIRRFAPRLQKICLQLEQVHFKQLAGIGPFPILEHVAVALPFQEHEVDPSGLRYLELFSDAPRLQLLSYAEGAVPSMFLLPYGGLSVLTCDRLTGDDFLDLVKGAPCLEHLTGYVQHGKVVSHTEAITHNHLQTLRLINDSSPCILGLLRLPVLQTLHFSLFYGFVDEGDADPDFLSFLAHSSASLRTFSIDKTPPMEWFSIAMPGLTNIEISSPDLAFALDFFSKLDRTQDKGFLPHLRFLTFKENGFPMDASILRALSSRCAVDERGSKLQSFRQVWPCGWSLSIGESTSVALRELRKQGMKIHVGHSFKSVV